MEILHSEENGDWSLSLEDGSRFALDLGDHPEWGTRDCTDPWDLENETRRGDLLMGRLADLVGKSTPQAPSVDVYRHNVDNSGSGASWGCHEIYDPGASFETLQSLVLPHLASRMIYAGAGGFDPVDPGIRFVISPRAALMTCDISASTTENRGLINVRRKESPLDMLRVISAERVDAPLPSVLTIGSTMILLMLGQRGRMPTDSLEMVASHAALNTFSRDPGGRATVQLGSGRKVTALELQLDLCRFASEQDCLSELPAWVPRMITLWENTLWDLAHPAAPSSLTPEWVSKRHLFTGWYHYRGFDQDQIEQWNSVLDEFAEGIGHPDQPVGPDEFDRILVDHFQQRRLNTNLMRLLKTRGLDHEELEVFRHLRTELMLLDTMLSRVQPQTHSTLNTADH